VALKEIDMDWMRLLKAFGLAACVLGIVGAFFALAALATIYPLVGVPVLGLVTVAGAVWIAYRILE
jgi:hypothetical protein